MHFLIEDSILQNKEYQPFLSSVKNIGIEYLPFHHGQNVPRFSVVVVENIESKAGYENKLDESIWSWFFSFSKNSSSRLKKENLFHFSNKNFEKILGHLFYLKENGLQVEEEFFLRKSFQDYDLLLERAKKFGDQAQSSPEGSSEKEQVTLFLEGLLQVAHEILNTGSLEDLANLIYQMTKSFHLCHSCSFLTREQLYEKESFFPIIKSNSEYFIQFEGLKEKLTDFECFVLASILKEIENFFYFRALKKKEADGDEVWSMAFNAIPTPLALFSQRGDLILHNKAFSQLKVLPRTCLSFKDSQTVEIGPRFYKILRREIESDNTNYSYFIFESAQIMEDGDEKNSVFSSEELGIISSSIAHELNNPLAGILAACGLLKYEQEWDLESLTALDEMEKGSRRCKELVDIFLGFSKMSPQSEKRATVADAFLRAQDLLRFRMIEDNVRLEMKLEKNKELIEKVNPSLMSMAFYLILNEILTAFAHHKLISSKVEDNCIRGSLKEDDKILAIEWNLPLDIKNKVEKSKLIKHLLQLEGFYWEVTSQRIVLKKRD